MTLIIIIQKLRSEKNSEFTAEKLGGTGKVNPLSCHVVIKNY